MGNTPSRKGQNNFLIKVAADREAYITFILLDTKNGRHHVLLSEHFHFLNTPILCPICCLCNFLIHRLSIRTTPFCHEDYIFTALTKQGEIPLPDYALRRILERICINNNWHILRPHDFKRGVLTWLWYASERMWVPERILLQVGNHFPDYCQKYLTPELKKTYRLLQLTRQNELNNALNNLPKQEHKNVVDLMASILGQNPAPGFFAHQPEAMKTLTRVTQQAYPQQQGRSITPKLPKCEIHKPLKCERFKPVNVPFSCLCYKKERSNSYFLKARKRKQKYHI